ncbi:hypothetical protein EBZ80_19685 [bacterium]|nr:hypothetical protein [bacterium]
MAKKALTVTAGNQSVIYGTVASAVTGAGTFSYSGFVNGDTNSVVTGTVTYTTTYTATTAAGTSGVTITPVTTSLTATNYSFSPADGAITVTALNNPGTLSATSGGATHPMTRVALSWAKTDNRDVLIVRNTSDSWTTPSTGTGYTAGQSIGTGTVVYKGSGTSMDNDLLQPGTTYYYRFYSENFSNYSAGITTSATTAMPQSRNAGTPVSPSTLYVGDTATFSLDSTATITCTTNTNWGQPRIYIKQGDGDLASGLRTDGTFTNVAVKSVASTNRFTNSGTWYWGFAMSYGPEYGGGTFWHKASRASYADMATDGNGSTLTLNVSALPNPASLAVSGTNTNSITLSYSRQGRSGAEFAAVVVRKAGSAVDWTPTPGQTYSNGFSTNGNTIVAWQNFTTGITDSGLSNNTTILFRWGGNQCHHAGTHHHDFGFLQRDFCNLWNGFRQRHDHHSDGVLLDKCYYGHRSGGIRSFQRRGNLGKHGHVYPDQRIRHRNVAGAPARYGQRGKLALQRQCPAQQRRRLFRQSFRAEQHGDGGHARLRQHLPNPKRGHL